MTVVVWLWLSDDCCCCLLCSAQCRSSSPSPICLESFRPSPAGRSPCHLQLQQQQRMFNYRLHATSPPLSTAAVSGCDQSSSSSSTSTSSRHALVRCYGAVQPTDADRQRRDSGVLIEDTEPGDADTPTTATSILPMPELVVERIGRIASAARWPAISLLDLGKHPVTFAGNCAGADTRGDTGDTCPHPSKAPSNVSQTTSSCAILQVYGHYGNCGPFRWLCSPQTAFCILRQKWLETKLWVDEMIIGRKSSFFHTPLHSTPPSEYHHPVWCGKTRMVWLPDGVWTCFSLSIIGF